MATCFSYSSNSALVSSASQFGSRLLLVPSSGFNVKDGLKLTFRLDVSGDVPISKDELDPDDLFKFSRVVATISLNQLGSDEFFTSNFTLESAKAIKKMIIIKKNFLMSQ
jgi:hypothetical protein